MFLRIRGFLLGLILLCLLGGCLGHSPSGPGKTDSTVAAAISKEVWVDPVSGMAFAWVPGRCFEMGQGEAEKTELIAALGEEQYRQWFGGELPRHRVCVDGFWMGKHEVTAGAFKAFLQATGYQPTAVKRDWTWCMTDRYERRPGVNHAQPGFEQDDRHPVVHVSWIDAQAMADWLTTVSQGEFRLPTEAEWELACRGGATASRFWGDDPAGACDFANGHDLVCHNDRGFFWPYHECRDGYVETAPVGSFQPNAYGLYDMLGNVAEWCRDVFSPEAYDRHDLHNPAYVQGEGTRVVRGGGWYSAPADMRCAVRRGNCPMNTDDALGFRLVRTERGGEPRKISR